MEHVAKFPEASTQLIMFEMLHRGPVTAGKWREVIGADEVEELKTMLRGIPAHILKFITPQDDFLCVFSGDGRRLVITEGPDVFEYLIEEKGVFVGEALAVISELPEADHMQGITCVAHGRD
jgi:hypothetical protein